MVIYNFKPAASPSFVSITDRHSGLISRTVRLGARATLSCSSSATSPRYQWYHNGSEISGAVSSWYTVWSASFSDAGRYKCQVSNLVGTGYGYYQLRVQGMEHAMLCMNIYTAADSMQCCGSECNSNSLSCRKCEVKRTFFPF